ncbi:hypothetical protein [Methanotorris formicicus]|uniref:Uncharacterized protein n=1 Tax=Methanotorris formicicus Mc-S-70 TaxID=647171 RepID=H1KZR7_9EURY|nr:hypothetical protein [Methanotorris formicicus]EHP85614.1 hypothetical protein MetfoDRAFT_1290 [Methanotorris formicicus Mc-S-70]
MDKKMLIGIGLLAVISVAIFYFFNDSQSNKSSYPKTDYDDRTWLEITVQGDSEGVKLSDKKLHILVGITSYDPSKIGVALMQKLRLKGVELIIGDMQIKMEI